MYAVTLNELWAILKVSAQEEQSGAVNKTSVESMAQDNDFREVKRCKRHISHTAKKWTKPVPMSAAVKLPSKTVLTHNFFTPLRATDMETETTGTENTLPVQKIPRKPGRLSPTMIISTTNLIQLQSELNDHVKGEHQFRNTRNETHIIRKDMEDYSAMKSCLEKNNLHYFTFSPDSEKPMKAVIRHLPTRHASGRYFKQP
jgi:hypothetical protein